MQVEAIVVYSLAAGLVLVALRLRSNSLRVGRITGPVVVGDNSGTINQAYSETAAPRLSSPTRSSVPLMDRAAPLIGIMGVLVGAAQFAYDVFFK
jgi:hypothetical protein